MTGLGSFAGGLTQGYDTGLSIQEKRQQLAAAQAQAQARAALAKSMTQGGGQPQIPGATPMPPGVPSQPAAPQQSLGSLGMLGQPQGGPSGAAAPPQPAPAPPMGGSGPPPMGGPHASPPGGAPPPMAGGGAPPASPGLGAGGAAQGGPQQPPDPFGQMTQNTLKSVYQQIAQANPGIKPAALFEAAQLQIGQMKGLESDTKAYMQMQVKLQEIDAHFKEQAMKDQDAMSRMQTQLAAKDKQIQEITDRLLGLQDKRNQGTATVAGINKSGKLGAAAMGANSRLGAAGIGAASREKVQGMRDETTLAVTDKKGAQGAASDQGKNQARIRAATIAAGRPDPGPGSGGGADGAASKTPPVSALKEGVHTKFANGQTWTLSGGNPVQVQ